MRSPWGGWEKGLTGSGRGVSMGLMPRENVHHFLTRTVRRQVGVAAPEGDSVLEAVLPLLGERVGVRGGVPIC